MRELENTIAVVAVFLIVFALGLACGAWAATVLG